MGEVALTAGSSALAELASLRERFGPLVLYMAGGCCDGSSPLCLPRGELLVGANDLSLGELEGTPFLIDAELFERWGRPAFRLELRPGSSDTFSIEGLDDLHFSVRSA